MELFVCWLDFFTCLSQTITCPLVICQGHLCSCPLSKCNSVLSAIKTFTVFPLLLTWKRGKMFVCWLDYLRCLSQTVIWQNVTASCLQLKLSHFFLCYLHEKGCKCLYVDLISSAVFFSLSFVLLSFGKMSQHHVYNLNFHFFLLLLTWKGVKMFVCWLDFYRRHLCSCHLAKCRSILSAIKTFAFFPLLLTWKGVKMFVCWLDFFGCIFYTVICPLVIWQNVTASRLQLKLLFFSVVTYMEKGENVCMFILLLKLSFSNCHLSSCPLAKCHSDTSTI